MTLLAALASGTTDVTTPDTPTFLVVQLSAEHPNQLHVLGAAAAMLKAEGATVHAWAPAARVACFEPGTVASGLLIASVGNASRATALAREWLLPQLRKALPPSSVPLVLRVTGLPSLGLPEMMDIPTVASVPRPPRGLRNALMVIQGRATDPARMDQYRDIILPMMKERGSYYEVFALAEGEVEALSGSWGDQIFAISRWPTRASAEDFWLADRYQREAIPKRIGAGRFTVHVLDQEFA
jgi:uncharacterized protein (DUF1330 family)